MPPDEQQDPEAGLPVFGFLPIPSCFPHYWQSGSQIWKSARLAPASNLALFSLINPSPGMVYKTIPQDNLIHSQT